MYVFSPQNLFYILNAIAGYFIVIIAPISNVYPIVVSYIISAIREIIEDVNRYKSDKLSNERIYQKIVGKDKIEQVQSKDIKQGDIIILKQNDIAPADCLILSQEENKTIFVQTSALDGEQNFKPRNCILTDEYIEKYDVRIEEPEPSLSQFNGMIKLNNQELYTHFSIQNVLLSCTKIQSLEDSIKALVIYCGKQSKINQTQLDKQIKQSKLHKRIIFLTCFEALLAVLITVFFPLANISTMQYNHLHFISFENEQKNKLKNYLEKFVCYFILTAYLLPVSLFVIIEVMRLVNAMFFNSDKRIEGSIKNTMAMENLGEVDYIVTDKTGTLTKNQLQMYQIASNNAIQINNRNIFELQVEDYNKYKIDANVMWNLAICNDIHIHPQNKSYQGESLDEIVFIQSCLSFGVQLISRNQQFAEYHFTIDNQVKNVKIQILAQIKFDSVNKYSFGIYQEVQNEDTGEYILPTTFAPHGKPFILFKGSEQLLDYATNQQDKLFTQDILKQYSQKGLRTLVFMYKQIEQETLDEFLDVYPQIKSMNENNAQFYDQVQKLKCDLQISGVTAIQDELQDDIKNTIKYLSKAGIRQSMITGDRVETALNIGYNCGLVDQENKIIDLTKKSLSQKYLQDQISEILLQLPEQQKQIIDEQFQQILFLKDQLELNGFKKLLFKIFKRSLLASKQIKQLQTPLKYTLLIDNIALKQIVEDDLEYLLAMLLYLCHSCIFARMSPVQKQQIVQLLKSYFPSQTVLAIGDGANDRSMIQESDIGIAILGNEGLSAANVADVIIKEFKYLKTIIAFHGRHNHNRYKELFEYQIEKNSILAFANILYGSFVLGTQTIVMDSWLLMMFNVVIALFPIFVQSISEQDIPEKAILEHPEVYRKQRYMRRPTLLSIVLRMLRSLWYSICLIVIPFLSHGEGGQFSDGTVSDFNCEALVIFLALLFSTSIELFLHQNYYSYFLLASFVLMVVIVAISVWIFNYSTLFGSTLIGVIPTVQEQLTFYLRFFITGMMCSTPSILYQTVRRLYYPDASEILRHQYGKEDNTCCNNQYKQTPLLTHKSTLKPIISSETQLDTYQTLTTQTSQIL